jgi:hypothetical protein
MGGACGTYWGKGRCVQGFVGNLRERSHLKDLGIDGRIILKWILNTCNGEAWIDLP